jgi:hypothetical protein
MALFLDQQPGAGHARMPTPPHSPDGHRSSVAPGFGALLQESIAAPAPDASTAASTCRACCCSRHICA